MKEIFKNFLPDYQISNFGRVYNTKTKKIRRLQCRVKNLDYQSLAINGTTYSIHRLVAEYFVENPNKLEYNVVHHKDRNPKNNHFLNLEWCTQKMNIQYQMECGTHTSLWNDGFNSQKNETGKISKVRRKSKSGIKGIGIKHQKNGIRYIVHFNYGNISRYIGAFQDLEDAKNAYKTLHIEKYGVDPYESS